MPGDDFTLINFTANLRLASSYYPSVSEMCRRLGINRQQFMRYLAGTSFPSRHNLQRICDFFGFDEYEILMPQEQFRKIVRLRPNRSGEELMLPPGLLSLLSEAQQNQNELSRTHGFYHGYQYSYSMTGHILRSLVFIYPWGSYTLYKRLERLLHPQLPSPPDVYKYAGVAAVVGDRLHLIDRETITGNELTQTILYRNYRNRITLLTGLTMGVSGSAAHEPSAARIVLEYVGPSVDLRQAIAGCRLYTVGSTDIPDRIREHLSAGGRITGPLTGAPL